MGDRREWRTIVKQPMSEDKQLFINLNVFQEILLYFHFGFRII